MAIAFALEATIHIFYSQNWRTVLLKLFWLLPQHLTKTVCVFFLDTHLYIAHVLKLRRVINVASDGVGSVC